VTEFLTQTLNGLSFAGVLFLLSSGFTLIFGLMRIVNMAHGATYLVGGYVAYSVLAGTGSYLLAIIAAPVAMAVLGLLLERVLLQRIRGLPEPELLLTMGVAFVMTDLALGIWGGDPLTVQSPGFLRSSLHLGSITYPIDRLAIFVLAVLIGVALYYVLVRTRTGAIIRAGVDDREMVSALGINVGRVFTIVFVAGALLAGLAGVLGGGLLTLYPGGDSDILALSVVVVIIGGLGKLEGAIVGSFVVGLLNNYANAYFPEFAYFSLFAPMIVVLLWRPQGLFGSAAV
jgi:branched-chain amino acid transport system permease protein